MIKQCLDQTHASLQKVKDDNQNQNVYPKLPYVKSTELKIRKIINEVNRLLSGTTIKVKLVYNTLKSQSFFKNKDKVPDDIASNIVYKYVCDVCDKTYVGATSRHFITRIKEHIKGNPVSELSTYTHPIKRDNFSVCCKSKSIFICETLIIQTVPRALFLNNSKSSVDLRVFD